MAQSPEDVLRLRGKAPEGAGSNLVWNKGQGLGWFWRNAFFEADWIIFVFFLGWFFGSFWVVCAWLVRSFLGKLETCLVP